MRGVILAGGLGTRLLPFTKVINKHLLPVVNQPMIYFPIHTLRAMNVTDILIVTGGEHIGSFIELLGDGSQYGVNLTYRVQMEPGGIAQALSLAEGFVDGRFYVILGDNYFENPPIKASQPSIYIKRLQPEAAARFGVFNGQEIIEKPTDLVAPADAVTGLYSYDTDVFNYIRTLKPSARGELEITDVNNWYLSKGELAVLPVDGEWSDMGTFNSLMEVATREYRML